MATTTRSPHPASYPSSLDAAALEAALRSCVRGEVRFSAGDRALYSTDASNYRQVPIGVVVPRDADDVVAAVAACRQAGAPVLMRGGGTSLAGQCCNVAVVLDCSKYMHRVVEVDPQRKLARVQPGVVLDDLRDAAEKHHLTYGPDPATHNRCTLGGMIGNNSCGVHSLMAGKTDDNIEELEILTYDGLRLRVGQTGEDELERIIREGGRRGEIYAGLKALRDRYADQIRNRYPDIPRRVSGYNLPWLLPEKGFHVARALVGSEGTCITVLEATVNLVHSPPARALVALGYPDVYQAADAVPDILKHDPIGLEGIDNKVVMGEQSKHLFPEGLASLPQGHGFLLVEFGAETRPEAEAKARTLVEALKQQEKPPDIRLAVDPADQKRLWHVREAALGVVSHAEDGVDRYAGWEDSAVPPDRLGKYLRDLDKLFDRYGYTAAIYGHFGQGCIHCRVNFDLITSEGIRKFVAFMYDAADLCIHYGGSVSGEHGDGQARAQLLPKMFGEDLIRGFSEFKRVWDPDWKMNPGKVVDPYPMDSDLRLGNRYNPPRPRTQFAYPSDQGSFARATLRCVGVGECRKHNAGTMCPSYMATGEEMHSTRGRARLLFEMLEGNPMRRGWRDETVKEALDLCLACKGCKGECPVHVDMATYKAEFLSHYFRGRLRPRSAYAFGLMMYWARLAALAPGLANIVTQTPLLRDLAKAVVGIAPQRQIPTFAPRTFRAWFAARGSRNLDKSPVILWADTWNNYFLPETARAAVEVLEAGGFQVRVPDAPLCCGRPVYDFGMIDVGRRLLRQVLDTLGPDIERGTPIVVLEPSCLSVFRDELLNLFPHDENAVRLSRQCFLLGEFLHQKAPEFQPPKLDRRAVVHGHCHHKALLGMADEEAVLTKLGLDFVVLDSGCCGMAGAFGFETPHYDVSMKVGERVLLPAVRHAPADALIVADGFSCREQIAQTTDRRALHLSEVLRLALKGSEQTSRRSETVPATISGRSLVGAAAGLAALGIGLWARSRAKRSAEGVSARR